MDKPRPSVEEYKMAIAVEVASRNNCLKAHVGAILVHEDRIRAVGYNGTVEGYADCFDGGCPRCKDMKIGGGGDLDRCVCVHAEENALISAARFGIQIDGAECYVTHEPCLACTKHLIQAHVSKVVYLKEYQHPDTGDHNASRQALREYSMSKRASGGIGTEFHRFSPRNATVEAWLLRLELMKKGALEYGRAKRILVNDEALD